VIDILCGDACVFEIVVKVVSASVGVDIKLHKFVINSEAAEEIAK
jgi:hypothetical protein